MEFELTKEDFETLSDEKKELYFFDGESKYVADPVKMAGRLSEYEGLKRNYDRLLDETKKAKEKAREYEEAKAEALKVAEEKELELQARNGDFESIKKSYEAKINAAAQTGAEENKVLKGLIHKLVVENDITAMCAELAVGKSAPLLSAYLEKRVRAKYTDDGNVVPEYLDNAQRPTAYTRTEFMNIIKGDPSCASIIRASDASGGGHQGVGATQTQNLPQGGGAGSKAAGNKKLLPYEDFKAQQEIKLQEFLKKNGG